MKKLISLENLIYLTVFILPLYLVRFSVFGIPTNVFETTVFLIFIFWLIEKQKQKFYNFYNDYKNYIFFSALIFFGFLFSTLANGDYGEGFGIIKGWFLVPIAFTLLVADNVAKERLKNILLAYYLSALGVAIAALGYYFLGFLTFDGRLQAIFNSPNYLMMYLAPGFIIGIFKLVNFNLKESENQNAKIKFQNDNSKFKTYYILGIFLIGAVIYFTKSYAGWIALLLSLASALFINYEKRKKRILISIAIVLLLIFTFQLKSNKFVDLITFNSRSSLASREMIWKAAGKMLENNWILGIGPGNFEKVYLSYQKYFPPYLEWAVPHPHNVYLAWWLSGGILGIVGFLGLIVFFFRDIFKKIKISREIKKDTKACFVSSEVLFVSLGIMLYILLHGLFDTTYFKNDLAVVFWLCFLALKKEI